jgi:glyoxylase-like metal-dependent hydrolase (beta-lactamase superfamily II)
MAYEVYALRYGERPTPACQFFYRDPSHEPVLLAYYVWLVLGGPHPVVVDVGGDPREAFARGLGGYVSPAAMLERVGVRAADVPLVVITHLHWDHWAGHAAFPAAEFWIQRDEVAFWTGPAARHDVFRQPASPSALGDLVRLGYEQRVRLVDGEREVLPGLRLHAVGGHTPGLQVVSVETARGPVVLTSDASHFYRNVERRQPVQIATDLPAMMDAFDTIEALAGPSRLVVAGHDPEVETRFTRVEPGIARIA